MADRTCSVPGCERTARVRGWCKAHYSRWWTGGDVRADMPLPTYRRHPGFPENLLSKLRATEVGCVEFTGGQAAGYGVVRRNGRIEQAHRAMYELMVEPIPEGLEIDHLCENKVCVNPGHLEPVTHAENIRRNYNRHPSLRQHTCKRGHPFYGENLYVNPTTGKRKCRACRAAYQKAWKAQARAAKAA